MKTHHFLCLGLLLVAGCRAKTSLPGAGQTDPITAPAPMPQPLFEISARAAQAQVEAGKPIALEIEVKNVSKQTQNLEFSSGQSFDFVATREGETEAVWSYAMNKRFIQSLRTIALEAGKSLHFDTVWNGALPGKYSIQARITANGGLDAAPFQILVK